MLVYIGNYRFGELGFRRTEFRALTRRYWHPHPERCVAICRESCWNDLYCIDEYRKPSLLQKPKYFVQPMPGKGAAVLRTDAPPGVAEVADATAAPGFFA